jgi:hypothetical protein
MAARLLFTLGMKLRGALAWRMRGLKPAYHGASRRPGRVANPNRTTFGIHRGEALEVSRLGHSIAEKRANAALSSTRDVIAMCKREYFAVAAPLPPSNPSAALDQTLAPARIVWIQRTTETWGLLVEQSGTVRIAVKSRAEPPRQP